MARLKGKVALITGAGTGIGRASAVLFAREGAQIAIAEINEAAGDETARLIREIGGEAITIRTDVTDPDSVQNAVAQTVARLGKLNVLYNNAGGSTAADGPATTAPLEEFWRAIKLDLYGTFLGCRFAVPEMIKAGGGSIINASSIVALMGTPLKDAYTAAKGGISALTRSMAVEFAPHKIRVNAVAPGVTLTDRVRRLLVEDGTSNTLAAASPLGTMEPMDIAYAALYLASDESHKVTGHILPIDGGALAG
ncbi:MAG: SDR family oxidoreductase [Acetobacteraceae bacterium]|nr:SDR family oxidoreductase [Acetobacteraceae bacterium]